jgi:hypothetical protein
MPVPTEINSALISGLASLITALIGLIIRAIEKPQVIKKALEDAKNAQTIPTNETTNESSL